MTIIQRTAEWGSVPLSRLCEVLKATHDYAHAAVKNVIYTAQHRFAVSVKGEVSVKMTAVPGEGTEAPTPMGGIEAGHTTEAVEPSAQKLGECYATDCEEVETTAGCVPAVTPTVDAFAKTGDVVKRRGKKARECQK